MKRAKSKRDPLRSLRRGAGRRRLHTLLFLTLLLVGVAAHPVPQKASPEDSKPVSRFGRQCLGEAELIAEVGIERIYHLGMGLDVVKIQCLEVILNRLPPRLKKRSEHLVLAYRGQFTAETRLMLVLKRYGKEDRLTALHRLSRVEKFYSDKARLLREYVRIEGLPRRPDRLRALACMVFENLEDGSSWVRENSLFELRGLVDEEGYPFTSGDVKFLRAARDRSDKEAFKQSLGELLESIEPRAVEGPSVLEGRKGEEQKERLEDPPSEGKNTPQ